LAGGRLRAGRFADLAGGLGDLFLVDFERDTVLAEDFTFGAVRRLLLRAGNRLRLADLDLDLDLDFFEVRAMGSKRLCRAWPGNACRQRSSR
jgi:hypothetical protein